MRKTIPVTTAIERGNHFLANSEDDQTAQRAGVASFLEALLHEADAYAGFNYLPSAQVSHPYDEARRTTVFHAEDETRRFYYVKAGLQC
jgi:hypothetical protein